MFVLLPARHPIERPAVEARHICDGDRIGRIVGPRYLRKTKNQSNGVLDLFFWSAAVAADGFFDLWRRVLSDRDTMAGEDVYDETAHHRYIETVRDIFREVEALYACDVGSMRHDECLHVMGDLDEPIRHRGMGESRDDPIGQNIGHASRS